MAMDFAARSMSSKFIGEANLSFNAGGMVGGTAYIIWYGDNLVDSWGETLYPKRIQGRY
jgi:hypothetical protein